MVEELGLEKVYERRGIELITPAAGSRILDRLLHQSTPAVVAISADWNKARQFGLGGALPPMLAGLETVDASPRPPRRDRRCWPVSPTSRPPSGSTS